MNTSDIEEIVKALGFRSFSMITGPSVLDDKAWFLGIQLCRAPWQVMGAGPTIEKAFHAAMAQLKGGDTAGPVPAKASAFEDLL